MIKKRENYIVENGKKRLIDIKELYLLSRQYLPKDMSVNYKDQFVDEIIFRIEGLEFNSVDTKSKTIEEYMFATCLAYAEEKGFGQFFEEEDDGNVFEYCGAELD